MGFEEERKKKKLKEELTMGGLMVAVEFIDVGCTTLSKVAMRSGMNNFVFVVYAHALGSLFLIPPSFLYHRKVTPPPLTLSILLRLFLLGFFCFCCSLFLFLGVGLSSPTLASAISNLSPAFTFILAVICRMETLELGVYSSLLKSFGTIVSIAGAFVVTFYQGWPIYLIPGRSMTPSLPDLNGPDHLVLRSTLADEANWVLGGFLLTLSSVFASLIYIVKAWVLRDYPSELLAGLISTTFETAVAVLVAFFAVEDFNDWRLGFNSELVSIFVAAILIVGVLNLAQSWACRIKGPVYVVMFKPLTMIIAILLGLVFLGDTLHIGSVLGGTTIALGFYTVMKGKSMEEGEEKRKIDGGPSSYAYSSSQQCEAPLLLNKV